MKQFLISLDQTANTLIYVDGDGWGTADEAISARAFRCYLQGLIPDLYYKTIDALFFWQEAHCHGAWQAEIERSQLPNHYRGTILCQDAQEIK